MAKTKKVQNQKATPTQTTKPQQSKFGQSRVRWALGIVSLLLLVCVGFAATTQRASHQFVPIQQVETSSVLKNAAQPVSYSPIQSRPRSIDDEEVDPATWRDIDLVMTKPHGGKLEMGLLRPLWWIAEVRAEKGKTIRLSIPEMGVEGPTKVLSIKPMERKENETVPEGMARVTGTFKHSAANVLDLQLEGEDEPIGVTYTHPFRSADRNNWVVAGELKKGERVVTRTGTTKVISLKNRPGQVPVYNLEVHKQHTYFVGKSGTWVHNSCVYWDGTNWRKVDGTIGDAPAIKRTPGVDPTLDRAETIIDGGIVKINSGHGYNRPHTGPGGVVKDLRNTGLSMEEIEIALLKDLSNAIKNGVGPAGKTPILRQVSIGGHTIEYRVVQFNPGEYAIGTYYLL